MKQTFADGSTYDPATGIVTAATTSQANQTNKGLSDFTSQDPAIKNQVALMQQSAYQQSTKPEQASSVVVPPAPPGSSMTPNYNYQAGKPGGVVAPNYGSPTPYNPNTGGASSGITGSSAPSVTPPGGSGSGIGGFGDAWSKLVAYAQNGQQKQTERDAMIQQLMFNQPLTSAQLAGLSPEGKAILDSGDNTLLTARIGMLNDQIKGNADQNIASMNYLMSTYNTQQQDLIARKDAAYNDLLGVVNKPGVGTNGLSQEDVTAIQNGQMPSQQGMATIYQNYKDSQTIKSVRTGTDMLGNPIYSLVQGGTVVGQSPTPVGDTTGQPTSQTGTSIPSESFAKLFPDGSVGGECGTFAHQIVTDLPTMGNTIQSKEAMIDKSGISADQWRQDPQVGDALIIKDNLPAGHVAVVNAVLPNGKIQLTESNWHLDHKVTNNRTISIDDKNIYGAYRGTINEKLLPQGNQQGNQQSQDQSQSVPGKPLSNSTFESSARDLANGKMTPDQFNQTYGRSAKTAPAKQMIIDRAQQINPKFSPSSFKAEYDYATTPSVMQQAQAIKSAYPNIDKMIQLSQQASANGIKSLNDIQLKGSVEFGGQPAANFLQAQKLLGDDVSGILGFGSASDMKTKLGLDVIDTGLTTAQFASNMNQLKEFVDKKISSINDLAGIYSEPILKLPQSTAVSQGGSQGGDSNPSIVIANGITYVKQPDGTYQPQ